MAANPSNAAALSNLGALLFALHRYDEGYAMLVEAAQRDLAQRDDPVETIARRYGFGTAETLRRTFPCRPFFGRRLPRLRRSAGEAPRRELFQAMPLGS